MLNDLIGRVQQTQLTEKDPEAEQLLNQSLGRNPDSLYILAQTVLVQKYALEQAQAQIAQLKQQAIQPTKSGSFLGNLLGHHESAPPPPPPPAPGYGSAPSQPYAQPWTQVPSYGAPPPPAPSGGFGGGGGSFLRSAATTAAGVAAGALAFEGVESLMHGFGHSAGFGGGDYLGGMGVPQETVINNYYDDSDRQSGLDDSGRDLGDLRASNDDNLQPTLDDNDLGNVDLDDSSYDDSSSNDLS
jgi:hypothetical protein